MNEPRLGVFVTSVLEHQADRPCKMTSEERPGETRLAFDGRGRLVSMGAPGQGWTLQPTYDRRGRLTREALHRDGTLFRSYRYALDAQGRVKRSTTLDGDDPEIQAVFSYQGSRLVRFREQADCCGASQARLRYAAGKLIEVTISGHPLTTFTLAYDRQGRLSRVTRSQGEGQLAEEVELVYQDGRLVQAGSLTFAYACT